MKSIRLFFQLAGTLLLTIGINSCTTIRDWFNIVPDCDGNEFTCSYNDGISSYKYVYCEDGWYAYYYNGKLDNISSNSNISDYWGEYVEDWREDERDFENLNCDF
jgi:hypothetical protein